MTEFQYTALIYGPIVLFLVLFMLLASKRAKKTSDQTQFPELQVSKTIKRAVLWITFAASLVWVGMSISSGPLTWQSLLSSASQFALVLILGRLLWQSYRSTNR